MLMARLVDKFEEKKQFKSWCKKQTVFRLDGDKKGSYRTLSRVYDANMKAYLEKKHIGKGLVIINEDIKV